MNEFLTLLAEKTLLADGAMGSYIFEITGRLSEMNHVYEAFSADRSDLILNIHATYLRSGAQCLKTNTFGANREKLRAFGLEGRVEELNRAGVRVAREAIARHRDQTSSEEPLFVLGSVGPLPDAVSPLEKVVAWYREQIAALAAEGVDAILLETFTHVPHLTAAAAVARELAPRLPVIAQLSLHFAGPDETFDQSPTEWIRAAVEAGARVVGVN